MESRRTFLKQATLAIATTALPGVTSCVSIHTIKSKVPLQPQKIRSATVLWYSQTDNTRKCGEVLAKTFDKQGITVELGELRNFDKVNIIEADLLVIGSPVFYYDIPNYVKNFITSLPDLNGMPVAAYVTFGGPEGNQHNAACSILEGLVQKNGVPVGLETFMTSKSYPPSFKTYAQDLIENRNTLLPDKHTYQKVRAYAGGIQSEVEKGNALVFKRTLTLREFSTYFGPIWWTKRFVENHYIIEANCVECGVCVEKCPTNAIDLDTFSVDTETCVLCFGCINNCDFQAVNMEYGNEKLIGFNEFLKINKLNFKLPGELK